MDRRRRSRRSSSTSVAQSAVLLALAVLVIGLDALVFRALVPGFQEAVATVAPSRAEGLLASFSGGIGEEILTRLFLVRDRLDPSRRATWLAVVIAAVLFAAGYLPAPATVSPLTRDWWRGPSC